MRDNLPSLLDQANGMALRRARKERRLTQTAVGRILGVSQQRVSMYEKGSGHISFKKLEILAPALGVDVIFFLQQIILAFCSKGVSDTPQAGYSVEAVTAGWRELKREFLALKTDAARRAGVAAVRRIKELETPLA